MIRRDIEGALRKDAQVAPVIAIIGPRQSGKTTIARSLFSKHAYVTLEEFETREFASKDPRGFLHMYDSGNGLIIDEIQHVPQLLSYIQTIVDFNYRPGFYILTGSQNFLVNQAISQTLAGRISIQTLLPLSVHELQQASLLPSCAEDLIFKGGYPSLYSKPYETTNWYNDYIKTYLERDVRTISAVGDLTVFQRFIKLCAGRIGQVINLSSLAIDCGISHTTAKHWLSILEASYIIFLAQGIFIRVHQTNPVHFTF